MSSHSPAQSAATLVSDGCSSEGARATDRSLPVPSTISIQLAQVADLVKSHGWSHLLREVAFINRRAVIVEKDLAEMLDRPGPLVESGLRVVEIDKDLVVSGSFRFAIRHRYLKALKYLQRGYGGIGLARSNVILGDLWYYFAETTENPSLLHEDLRLFGFKTWSRADVYTFDIYVAPSERKQGVSAAFQNNGMLSLRSKGFTKAYGFYFADNLPAFWCTRVTNRWKELRVATVSRLLHFKRVRPIQKSPAKDLTKLTI